MLLLEKVEVLPPSSRHDDITDPWVFTQNTGPNEILGLRPEAMRPQSHPISSGNWIENTFRREKR